MNYMTELIENDLKYICSVIPYEETTKYFNKYPKEFSKIKPGFRVTSLNEKEVTEILFFFRNKPFISTFIVKHINIWLKEIEAALMEVKDKGFNTEASYINVLAQSVFSQNIPLYFKMIEEEKSEEYLSLITAAVNQLNIFMDKAKCVDQRYNKDLSEREYEINRLKKLVNDTIINSKKIKNQIINMTLSNKSMSLTISQKNDEIKELQTIILKLKEKAAVLTEKINKVTADSNRTHGALLKQKETLVRKIEELEHVLISYKEKALLLEDAKTTIINLETRIKEMDDSIHTLIEIKQNYESNINLLEESLSNYVNQEMLESKTINDSIKPLQIPLISPCKPVDMDEFDEYFNYNLNNIGLDDRTIGYKIFVNYIEKIVFSGMPLLIKHYPGINIANCLSNTLCGERNAPILLYSDKVMLEDVKVFLDNTPNRVVCIEGFVGNYNMLELLQLLVQYRNKIIIITYMCDRTLNYIPIELLAYALYINIDEFKSLFSVKAITEDPSSIEEESYSYISESFEETRYQRIFKEISLECGLPKDAINFILDSIDSEEYMNSVLLFTILPYVLKVLRLNPYNISNRLRKYAGGFGRCPNKRLMSEWFG
jgi:hypothetical protein